MDYKKVVIKDWPPIIGFFISALAMSIYPWLIIRKDWKDEEWLIKHEEVHLAEQKEMGTVKWIAKYFFSKKFRYEAELRGHAAAVKHGQPLNRAAREFSGNYKLGISFREAEKAISEAVAKL